VWRGTKSKPYGLLEQIVESIEMCCGVGGEPDAQPALVVHVGAREVVAVGVRVAPEYSAISG
jgi:hypothetical protein